MTDGPERLDLRSHDIADEKREQLFRLFPEARSEDGAIDFERLRLALGEIEDVGRERFGLSWPGKADCFKVIQSPSLGTLLPSPEESVNFETSENLIIEGDNLEVLKLLQKSYLGRVKMIYIDPPYNTGNDFIYPDDYAESLQTYLAYTGQVDANGRRFGTNTDSEGRFHTRWLNMMYPRLYLARNLLRDDGAIFISIDDGEQSNLRKICDEIFGEENFVASIVWQKMFSPKNTALYFSEDHEFVLVYARNRDSWRPELLPRSDETIARYANPDGDDRGPWLSGAIQARNPYSKGQYEVTSPSGKKYRNPRGTYWRFSQETFEEMDRDHRIWWGDSGDNVPRLKRFLSEVKQGVVPQTLWKYEDAGHSQEAKTELLQFVDFQSNENVLNSVKPTRLLRRMLIIATEPGTEDIVLDFFAGSGVTGHAVLDQNAEDGGNRRFILVQLPEPLPAPESSSLQTIADMAKLRVRNAATRLREIDEGRLGLDGEAAQDRGFGVFKLGASNFTPWDAEAPTDEASLAQQLEMHVHHIREGRGDRDLLYEILMKSGYPLTTPVKSEAIAGKTVYSIAEGMLLVSLDRNLTLDFVRKIADRRPERVVLLDEGFAGNDQLKANAAQAFKTKGIPSFRTI